MSAYGILAKYYDLLTGNVDYASYGEYITGIFRSNGVLGTVLDAGCGTGEMLSVLSRLNYDLIGVDKCPEMLSLAAGKSSGALLLQQDLLNLDLYGSVGGVISTLDVINHFASLESVNRFFSRAALFLESGGIFIFDINTAYKHECVLADNCFVFDLPDGMLVWQNFREDKSVLLKLDLFSETKSGKYERVSDEFREYTYSTEDIKALVTRDFDILEISDGESFGELLPDSQRAVFAVKKK